MTYEGLHVTVESGGITVVFDFDSQDSLKKFVSSIHVERQLPVILDVMNLQVSFNTNKGTTLIWQKD